MDLLTNPENLTALVTLTALEIVLGVDNVVFISVLTQKLPRGQQDRARTVGLGLAMGTRILLLLTLAAIAALTAPLVTLLGQEFSGRDLVLIAGGLFLLGKSTVEIHESLEGGTEAGGETSRRVASFASVIVQILLLDIVFSLDSVITAVGMAREIPVMVAAIVIAVLVMLVASGPIATFVGRHPTVKMLALSFLLLIGMSLVADGFGLHIPKEYLYFAMGFSVFVEVLNLRIRGRPGEPVHLRPTPESEPEP
ncbi:MAG TPA: TerC family protein [Candidatus Limnocylindrales bacterium]|nr:TerC family protein [Candidatus Limnocylindrales bacterium]